MFWFVRIIGVGHSDVEETSLRQLTVMLRFLDPQVILLLARTRTDAMSNRGTATVIFATVLGFETLVLPTDITLFLCAKQN